MQSRFHRYLLSMLIALAIVGFVTAVLYQTTMPKKQPKPLDQDGVQVALAPEMVVETEPSDAAETQPPLNQPNEPATDDENLAVAHQEHTPPTMPRDEREPDADLASQQQHETVDEKVAEATLESSSTAYSADQSRDTPPQAVAVNDVEQFDITATQEIPQLTTQREDVISEDIPEINPVSETAQERETRAETDQLNADFANELVAEVEMGPEFDDEIAATGDFVAKTSLEQEKVLPSEPKSQLSNSDLAPDMTSSQYARGNYPPIRYTGDTDGLFRSCPRLEGAIVYRNKPGEGELSNVAEFRWVFDPDRSSDPHYREGDKYHGIYKTLARFHVTNSLLRKKRDDLKIGAVSDFILKTSNINDPNDPRLHWGVFRHRVEASQVARVFQSFDQRMKKHPAEIREQKGNVLIFEWAVFDEQPYVRTATLWPSGDSTKSINIIP